jgi:hypothetical protein
MDCGSATFARGRRCIQLNRQELSGPQYLHYIPLIVEKFFLRSFQLGVRERTDNWTRSSCTEGILMIQQKVRNAGYRRWMTETLEAAMHDKHDISTFTTRSAQNLRG